MAEARNPEDCTVLYKIVTDAEAESIPAKAWKGNALDVRAGLAPQTLSYHTDPAFAKPCYSSRMASSISLALSSFPGS